MKIFELIIFNLIAFVRQSQEIWPPSYKINLTHEEVFVIGEKINNDNDEIFDINDEMINNSELKKFELRKDLMKFSRLHKLMSKHNHIKRNIEESIYNKKLLKKPTELPYEEEPIPWIGNLVKSSASKLLKNKSEKNNTQKREESTKLNATQNQEYDYVVMQQEYEEKMQAFKKSNDILNFTNVQEEESFKDALNAIVQTESKKLNCTLEEQKGIGLHAAKCILHDLTNPKTNPNKRLLLFHRIGTIIMIWILVYLLVAIPCWCQKGWCCCCFQCKFCKPKERIDMAKKFLLDNPSGVYHDANNQKIIYSPSSYEKYLQNKLEKALMKI